MSSSNGGPPILGALKTRWHNIREGFLFYPGLTVLGLSGVALVAIQFDRRAEYEGHFTLVFGGDASAAREILSAIASSFVTVSGVTLSITIVTLQLVAGQYTPRAVRGFLSDRVNQLTAGGFVGVVAYCLIVLRVVRTESGRAAEFVPRLSVSIAIAVALLALGLLVFFVHHLATSVRVSNMTAQIARDTLAALKDPYPGGDGDGRGSVQPVGADGDDVLVIRPTRPGYVQTIALQDLIGGVPDGSTLDLRLAPGDFATETQPIAILAPRPEDEAAIAKLVHRAVFVTSERTIGQDAGFGVRQLTDIALRALSPGINDPTTAITCIGYLGACLEHLAAADPPQLARVDGERDVGVRLRAWTFEEYLEDSLVEVGRYAGENARVVLALLERIRCVEAALAGPAAEERRSALLEAARGIVQAALARAQTEQDRAIVRRHAQGLVPDEDLQQQV